jgi:anti-sigma factor RsiW
MTCIEIQRANTIQLFLDGKLTDSDREAFERHYMGCPVCFEQMQAAAAAATRKMRDEDMPDRMVLKHPLWIALAIAAALIATNLTWQTIHPHP